MSERDTAPLILTARFDAAAMATFQRLRDQHFPPVRNIVPAHATLFHHLPGLHRLSIAATLRSKAAGQDAIPFQTGALRFLGRGVAIGIEAPGLAVLRASLAALWMVELTAQDRQPFRPHVTIQNKADPAVARALHERLAATLGPLSGSIEGLDLWHYRGGPWEAADFFPFTP